eukprot:403356695
MDEYYRKYLCKPTQEFNFEKVPPKARKQFKICQEHQQNTCCQHKDVKIIHEKINSTFYEGNKIQYQCKDITEKIFCSTCDGDIGIHKKKGLCYGFCETWFDLCHAELFVINPDLNNMLQFATEDTKLRANYLMNMINDAEEFCTRMGFQVYNEPHCYNGVPTGSIVNLNKQKPYWQQTKPKNKGSVDWSLLQILRYFTYNTKAYGDFLFYIGILSVLIFILYEINIWQTKMRNDQQHIYKQIQEKEILQQQRKSKKILLQQQLDILKKKQSQENNLQKTD